MKNLPFESTDKDAHKLTVEGKSYDVYKLIRLTSHTEHVEMKISTLEPQILNKCWKDSCQKDFSPRDLLSAYRTLGTWEAVAGEHPTWSDHIRRINQADRRYPLLLYQGDVVDGTHRLIRALVEGVENISAKILDKLPEEARHDQRQS